MSSFQNGGARASKAAVCDGLPPYIAIYTARKMTMLYYIARWKWRIRTFPKFPTRDINALTTVEYDEQGNPKENVVLQKFDQAVTQKL